MKLSLEFFDNILAPLFKDPRIAVMVTFFLVFYGGLAGPKLPPFVMALFESPVFRIFILSLIVYRGNKNPMIALLVAVGFTLVMDTINKKKLFEKFTKIEGYGNTPNSNYDHLETFADNEEDPCLQTDEYKRLDEAYNSSFSLADKEAREAYLKQCYESQNQVELDANNMEVTADDLEIDDSEEAAIGNCQKPGLPDNEKEDLSTNIQTYASLNAEQSQIIVEDVDRRIKCGQTAILTEEEISDLLPPDVAGSVNLATIIGQLEPVQNTINALREINESDSPVDDELLIMDEFDTQGNYVDDNISQDLGL